MKALRSSSPLSRWCCSSASACAAEAGGDRHRSEGLTRRLRDRRLLGDTGLVAGREIRERVRGRVFRVVTLILFAVVAAAVVIPTIHTGTTTRQKVGVVAGSPALDAELQKLATTVGTARRAGPRA